MAQTGGYGTDKSGGDATQHNCAGQLDMSGQALNSIGSGGAGVLDSAGGMGDAMGTATQSVHQDQGQNNTGTTGYGGSDNINANTSIGV